MNLRDVTGALRRDRTFLNLADGMAVYGEASSQSDIPLPEPLKPCFIAALAAEKNCPVLVISPTDNQAELFCRDIETYMGENALFMPARGEERGPAAIDPEATGRRAKALAALMGGRPVCVVTTAAAAAEELPPIATESRIVRIVRGREYDQDAIMADLIEFGYSRVYEVEDRGEFSVRGGIIDIFGPDMPQPVRLEFDGDEVASMRRFSLVDQLSTGPIENVFLYPVIESEEEGADIFDYAAGRAIVIADEKAAYPETPLDMAKILEAANITSLTPAEPAFLIERHPPFISQSSSADFDLIEAHIRGLTARGISVLIPLEGKGRLERFRELLGEWGIAGQTVTVAEGYVRSGFILPEQRIAILAEADMFGFRREKRRARQSNNKSFFSLMDLKTGDFVVHVYHGIGRYLGLAAKETDGIRKDYLQIEYAGGDKLYIPTDQVGLVQRYIAGEDYHPKIDSLSSKRWHTAKRKVRASAAKLAAELVALYKARKESIGHAFSADSPWQRELEESFPFNETPDQETAIVDVKRDMEEPSPMDRLICGDVGYGKTEVAVRAVFKAVMDGMQAVVLVPTTLLAEQHYETFLERFEAFPVRVEVLSRMRSKRDQDAVIRDAAEGKIDVLIGTHRLLQKDIRFKNLGIFVIDEEQRFGVRHKEFLKSLRLNVDVLTLTATPIPRTLNMALNGARDMSVIDTAPEDRFPVATYVREYDDKTITGAIERELNRGGQVFFVHNRVESIGYAAERIRRLVPGARVEFSHGQMSERALENVMFAFAAREFDVLVSTTIIESGLDMPNVNTLIVDRADKLGLSQLYQLRGRVGRSDRRAFAYFLYPAGAALSVNQIRRLKTIAEFTELGSGFRIALRDLEIRGAGSLLGGEQHGLINEVGFELYAGLLGEAVAELKGEPPKKYLEIKINLPVAAYIPETYVAEEALRIDLYKKIASIESADEADLVMTEFRDRFGQPPREAVDLLEIAKLKALAATVGVIRITAEDSRESGRPGRVNIFPINQTTGLASALLKHPGRLKYKSNERTLLAAAPAGGQGVSLLQQVLCDIITVDCD